MVALLALLGISILVRFIVGVKPVIKKAIIIKFLAPLGLVAGFVDATGSGGWGPVAAQLAARRTQPSKPRQSLPDEPIARQRGARHDRPNDRQRTAFAQSGAWLT
jgi:hypothetical protein